MKQIIKAFDEDTFPTMAKIQAPPDQDDIFQQMYSLKLSHNKGRLQ